MQSAEAVAAKRKVLIDALTMCLERSRVKDIVAVDTIKSILQSASGELWREGEFRLELVWKILCQQPGLSAKEVAPPLLAFKAFEEELGVRVRVPQALSAIPRGEQVRLRDQLKLGRQDFADAIERMRALAQDEQQPNAVEKLAQAASATSAPARSGKRPARARRGLALALAAVAAVVVAGSLALTLRDPAEGVDVADVAGIVQLADARRVDQSLTARIADPRWETLGKDEQRKLTAQLFERESQKGVRVLTLVDAQGRVRATATNLSGAAAVSVQ